MNRLLLLRVQDEAGQPCRFLREVEIDSLLFFWEKSCTETHSQEFENFWRMQDEGLPFLLKIVAYVQPVWGWMGRSFHVWKWDPGAGRIDEDSMADKVMAFLKSADVSQLSRQEQECAAAYLVLREKMQKEGRSLGDIHFEATEMEVAEKLENLGLTGSAGL